MLPVIDAHLHGADRLAMKGLRYVGKGNLLAALAAWRAAVERGASDSLVRHIEPVMRAVEGRTLREGPSAREPHPGPASPAWALAWAGDLEGARGLAKASTEDAVSLGVLGVVAVLERRPQVGLALLDRAREAGGSPDLEPHRIRALVHLGRLEDAKRALSALGDGESLGRRLVAALLESHERRPDPAGFREMWTRLSSSQTHLNGLYATTLPAIVGQGDLDEASRSAVTFVGLLEALLDRMAGNLGLFPTLAEVTPSGERRFVPLVVPPTARDQSSDALHSLPYVGVEGAEAALESVRARLPRSVHVRCYKGELYLWLGRYDDAWNEFAAADAIEPARWADIGLLAVLTLTGRYDTALRLACETERRFLPILGGTLPVYRGVLHRRRGELDEAIAALRGAVAAKPGRLGPRVELCLALRATGQRDEALSHAGVILRDGAPLLVDVAEAEGVRWREDATRTLDDPLLEAALTAMKGNRSSSLVTWVDRSGALRVLQPPATLRRRARDLLSQIRQTIEV